MKETTPIAMTRTRERASETLLEPKSAKKSKRDGEPSSASKKRDKGDDSKKMKKEKKEKKEKKSPGWNLASGKKREREG